MRTLYPAQQYKADLERFLWVKFQLQALREERSDSLILAALKDLPRDLPETFERILSKSTENDIELVTRIFRWVSVAKRPLTVEELREAMGIRPLQKAWDESTYINDMNKAIACCGNLALIEEEQQTVHFTHSSVKQYLVSGAIQESRSKYHVDPEKADEDAGAICVTYLNFPVFNRQVARTSGKSVSTRGITSTVIEKSLPLGKTGNKLALRFLRSLKQDNKSDKSVNRLLEQVAGDTEEYRQQQNLRHYSFRPYATQFWLEHTKQGISPESKQLWGLWSNLIWEASWRDTLPDIPWTLDDLKERATNFIQWVVEQNHCSLAHLIIGSDKRFDASITQQHLLKFVKYAAKKGHANLIAIVLSSELISQPILDLGVRAAAGCGHLEGVERLLQANANANAIIDVEITLPEPLKIYHANPIINGEITVPGPLEIDHDEMEDTQLLVHPNVNANQLVRRVSGNIPIDVVGTLLQANADVNTIGNASWTALQFAAAGGYLDVVERLLQATTNINNNGSGGMTALEIAAERGHLDVVERLLQANATINHIGSVRVVALPLAARGGHLGLVERLLQANADVNTTWSSGRTALHEAARHGYLDVVERLLEANADLNAVAFNRLTAIQFAAERNHSAVVERLRTAGAEW